MLDKNIEIDHETLDTYVIPFCNPTNPILLIDKLKTMGFTVKQLLAPTVCALLQTQQTELALKICKYL